MCILYWLFILIFLLIAYKLYKNYVTNDNDTHTNKKGNKIVECFTNTTDFNDPQFKFFKALDDIKSSDKIILDNVISKCYLTNQTIEVALKDKVIDILKNIISDLNNILKKDEYFVNQIDGLYIIKDDKQNYRMIISSVIHDVKNYYSVKFITDIVYMNNQYYLNYLNIDESATNNILNSYDVRQSDFTQGILLNYDMVNNDMEEMLNYHYKTNNNIFDIKNIKNMKYNFFKLDDLSKYYLPEGVPDLYSPSFCDKYNEKEWDSNGNPIKNNNIPESCIANNNSLQKILNQPYDAPGVLYQDKTSNYSWLFSMFSNAGLGKSGFS